MRRKSFPILWTIVLVYAIFWLLNELKILLIDIPWSPVILIIIAAGLIINRFIK